MGYGRTDGPTDPRTDKASYRDAWTHLKSVRSSSYSKRHGSNQGRCPNGGGTTVLKEAQFIAFGDVSPTQNRYITLENLEDGVTANFG